MKFNNNYSALIAEATRIKSEVALLDYFFKLESIGAIRYDGKKGKEFFFGFDHQKTGSISVKDQANLWYDHAKGDGGDIIKAVQLFEQKTFAEAIQRLSNRSDIVANGYQAFYKQNGDTEYDIEIFKVLDKVQHPALINYLHSRGLVLADISDVAKEVHWKNGEVKFFAIGFPNVNSGFAARSKVYKGNLNGGGISTFIIGNRPQSIKLFEGSMDFASYRHLHANESFNAIILNGTGNLTKTLCAQVTEDAQQSGLPVHLYFDNGVGGIQATTKGIALISGAQDRSDFYKSKGLNDVNDYLLAKKANTCNQKR